MTSLLSTSAITWLGVVAQGQGGQNWHGNYQAFAITLSSLVPRPHDGSKKSYGSLLELLDPTLVIDPEDISKDDLTKNCCASFFIKMCSCNKKFLNAKHIVTTSPITFP